jgi:TonB family protein
VIDLLKKWLNGTAKATDERALERKAAADDFLADAVEGYRSMPEADHTKNIAALKARLPQNKKRRDTGVIWWRMAAAAALVGVISTWIFIGQKPDTIGIAANETAVEDVQDSEGVQNEEAINQTAPLIESTSEETVVETEQPVIEEQGGPEHPPQAGLTSESKKDIQKEDDLVLMDEPAVFAAEAPGVLAKPIDSTISKLSTRELANASGISSISLDSNILSKQEAEEADVVINNVEIQADKELQLPPPVASEPAQATAKRKRDRGSKKLEQARSSISTDKSQILVLRGTVLESETDNPLIGANVIIKGSNEGVITDVDGRFELESSQSLPLVLELSYLGYDTQEVVVDNIQSDLVLRMEEGEAVLEEVVITGLEVPITVKSDPRPKGGWKKFDRYLMKNLEYPESAKAQRLEGTVKVGFFINEQGRPEQFKIMKSLCEPCDQEAVRLIEEGPKWRGKKKRTSVAIEFTL